MNQQWQKSWKKWIRKFGDCKTKSKLFLYSKQKQKQSTTLKGLYYLTIFQALKRETKTVVSTEANSVNENENDNQMSRIVEFCTRNLQSASCFRCIKCALVFNQWQRLTMIFCCSVRSHFYSFVCGDGIRSPVKSRFFVYHIGLCCRVNDATSHFTYFTAPTQLCFCNTNLRQRKYQQLQQQQPETTEKCKTVCWFTYFYCCQIKRNKIYSKYSERF